MDRNNDRPTLSRRDVITGIVFGTLVTAGKIWALMASDRPWYFGVGVPFVVFPWCSSGW
ncbi:hypothetical protein [Nocardiopsis sp. MG754419]|uniref:hypothetical protein n=1 Tax=Nocardiopsis sp. MG754419 TaxID=2259865 RepID=UPI001BAD8647|nr:hypothetical protein [Nocardiopsis sp. MG754419]